MIHPIYRITDVECLPPHSLRLRFDDGLERTVDLEPVMEGAMYGPLRDPDLFRRVRLNTEVGTIEWPNGADFDPAVLHDWPEHEADFRAAAARWAAEAAGT